MPKYTLYYFNGRGRAELARMLFAQAGVEFEDKRIAGEEWAALKPSTPFGSMPYLEVDGQTIAQSQAIARYLAREFGLDGSNSFEKAKVDEATECVVDMMQDFYKAAFASGTDAEKAEKKKEFEEKQFLVHQGKLEKIFSKNGTGSVFLVGSKVTYADLGLFCAMESLADLTLSQPLMKLKEAVANLPNIKAYLEKRPATNF